MKRETVDQLRKVAVQQGEANSLWKQLYAERSAWRDSSGLLDDAKLIEEMKRCFASGHEATPDRDWEATAYLSVLFI